MKTQLDSAQKREYLRLLFAEGQAAATTFLKKCRLKKWVFESDEELREYAKHYEEEIGEPFNYWAIVLCPPDTEEEKKSL